ncbi:hypothetical protein ACSLBF_06735 [Pseudoalteromonas sp. T1lg65]|uniref:hypothetical protein n=1 Tax=Pseudoalteromonas sp. T1lg65 TaxID=2077101 RepID=UPI003F79D4AF
MRKFSYRCTVDHQQKLVHAFAVGDCEEQDIVSMYKNLALTLRENQLSDIVLDVSELTLTYEHVNVLHVLKSITKIIENMTVARVVSPTDFKSGLIEAYAQKHSLRMQNFDSYRDALAWIKEEKVSK